MFLSNVFRGPGEWDTRFGFGHMEFIRKDFIKG